MESFPTFPILSSFAPGNSERPLIDFYHTPLFVLGRLMAGSQSIVGNSTAIGVRMKRPRSACEHRRSRAQGDDDSLSFIIAVFELTARRKLQR